MKVHFQQQCEHSECGLACAAMMIDYYTKKVKVSNLREKYGVPNGGYNLAQIQMVLSDNGIDAKAARINAESIKAVPVPFIAYWDKKHFVVIEKVTYKNVFIVDPASGKYKLSKREFEEHFSEVVLYSTNDHHRKRVIISVNSSLFNILKNNSGILLATILISVVLQGISLIVPYTIQYIIDMINNTNEISFNMLLISFGGLSLSYYLLYLIRTRIVSLMQTSFDREFLNTTIKQLLDLPYSYFVNRSKGELIYRINSNSYIRQVLIDQMIDTFIDVLFFAVYLIAMFIYSVKLAAITILLALTICICSYVNSIINKKIHQKEMVVITKSQDYITEMINNIFTIKSTNSQEDSLSKWSKNFDIQIGMEKEKAKYSSIFSNATTTIYTFYSLCIILLGQFFIKRQEITLGGVIAFGTIGSAFLRPIIAIMNSYGQIIMIKLYLERILDILATPNETDTCGNICPFQYNGEISIDDVSYKYSKFSPYAVKNATLKIKPYEKIAIVGASGSGKSTLMKIMASLYPATMGCVSYDKFNVKEVDIHKLREKVGIVLQESCLFGGTIRENITMGRDFSDAQVCNALEAVHLLDFVNSFPLGIDTIISEGGQNISGGQRQKIAIARTIISNPNIIFLDEPTSALDNESERIVMDYLLNMKSTMVVVAHRLSTIEKFDRIIVMDNGVIKESGKHAELLSKNGYYAHLYAEAV